MGASASTARGADGVAQRRMIKVGSAAAQFKKAKSHLTTSNSTVMPAHQAQFFIVEQSSECAKLDKQYTDGAFPQDIDPNHTKGQRVVWKRPGGFCEAAPHLFVDGVDFMDVVSGAFAGSALHAAMCVLAASRPDKIRELFINLPEGDGAISQEVVNEQNKPLLKKIKQVLKDRVEAMPRATGKSSRRSIRSTLARRVLQAMAWWMKSNPAPGNR